MRRPADSLTLARCVPAAPVFAAIARAGVCRPGSDGVAAIVLPLGAAPAPPAAMAW
jgi:hypothetical protein